jgi:hypothetical protein
MLPTHEVPCPGCGKTVYTALSLEDVVAADGLMSPEVKNDARGDYITCPHCAKRISMRRITTDAGVGFRIAPD